MRCTVTLATMDSTECTVYRLASWLLDLSRSTSTYTVAAKAPRYTSPLPAVNTFFLRPPSAVRSMKPSPSGAPAAAPSAEPPMSASPPPISLALLPLAEPDRPAAAAILQAQQRDNQLRGAICTPPEDNKPWQWSMVHRRLPERDPQSRVTNASRCTHAVSAASCCVLQHAATAPRETRSRV